MSTPLTQPLLEGFDRYGSDIFSLTLMWQLGGTAASGVAINPAVARLQSPNSNNGALVCSVASGQTAFLTQQITGLSGNTYYGMAVFFTSMQWHDFLVITQGFGAQSLRLGTDYTGAIYFVEANGTVHTGPQLRPGVWYFIELGVDATDTISAAYNLYVNGALVLSGATATFLNLSPINFELGVVNNYTPIAGFQVVVDDLYISQGSSAVGDSRIELLTAVSSTAGNIQFSHATPPNNLVAVDQIPVNTANFNFSDLPSSLPFDQFSFQTLPANNLPVWVQLTMCVSEHVLSGTSSQAHFLSSAGGGGGGSVSPLFVVPASATYMSYTLLINPNSGSPWTLSSLNSTLFGYQLVK